jgi:hypothetical protein
MAVKLHPPGFAHARAFVEAGNVFLDGIGAWSEHQPTEVEKNRYLGRNGLAAYGKWHLGVDDEEDEHSRQRYLFPCGDFVTVHRCGVLTVESEAGRFRYHDIRDAAAELHAMLDLLRRELESEAGASLPDDFA